MRTVLGLIETDGPGGAETVFSQLLGGLDRSRWKAIAVIPGPGWLQDQLVAAGIETIVLRERSSLDFGFFRTLRRLIRERHVDVIHGHLFGSSVRAALLSRLTNVPAVSTLHGISDLQERERLLGAKLSILRGGLARLVVVSPSLRNEFLAKVRFPGERVAVIPNGIDFQKFDVARDSSFRASLGIAANDFIIGSVGNLNAAKGFDVLLEAISLLNRSGHKGRVVIVGDTTGRQSAELMALQAKLGLIDDVVFAGFRSDVPQALAAFDMYALSSRSEGFSISLVEAMAAGLPVVATRCGGPEYIVRDNVTGLLVENSSPESLAKGIERLEQDDSLRARLGAAAREDVRDRFSIARQIQTYERLYEECIQDRAGARMTQHSPAHSPSA